MSLCSGMTTAVTEEGTGTWHPVGSQGWARRQCGTGRSALGSESEALSSALSPVSSRWMTSAKVNPLPRSFTLSRDPSKPRMPESSEQDKALQKVSSGSQVNAELAVKGGQGKASQPQSLHIVKRRRGRSRTQAENSLETLCLQGLETTLRVPVGIPL